MEPVVCKNIRWDKINVWCCKAFFPSEDIKQHQEEAHSDIVKSVKQSYTCGVCGKSFSRNCAAKIHERIHKSKFACDSCKMGFEQESFLKEHKKFCQLGLKSCSSKLTESSVSSDRIEGEHSDGGTVSRPDTNEDLDIVEISEVSNVKTLDKQEVNVNAVKNFSCLFCDKKFRRKYQVQQCENKHNGIFRHSCHLCEFKTNNKWHLDRHVNSHLNVKPFSCPVCKLKSVTKSDLRHHIRKQHETDGSILPHLEASYPQMYIASESNEGWRNDPLSLNQVPATPSARKRKWKDQPRVEYPTIVRSIDKYSPTKKKRKLFSPKSQKSELFPEVDESGFNETPKYSKVLMKGMEKDWWSPSLVKHCFKDEKEEAKDIAEDKDNEHVDFANEAIMTNTSVRVGREMQDMSDVLREVFNEEDENLFQGVPPLDQELDVLPSQYEYSVTEVNQTI